MKKLIEHTYGTYIYIGTVEVQLLRGGLRLAAVLNDIFG